MDGPGVRSTHAAEAASTLRGIALIVVAFVFFCCLDTTAKWLGQSMRSVDVAWLRYATSVAIFCVLFRVWGDLSPFRTGRPLLQLARGLTLVGATVFNFWALQYLQLAEANAINFAGPLLVTALAGPMLGETVGLRRWAAVAVGFVGVLVVLRPGVGAVHWAFGLSLGSMVCNSLYSLLTRRMHRTETSSSLLMLSALVGALILAPTAPHAVVSVEGWHWALALAMGLFAVVGHVALVAAHKRASASTLAPFGYVQMPLMVLFGWVLFDQLPDAWTVVGMLIIAASGLYVLHRERLKAREGRA